MFRVILCINLILCIVVIAKKRHKTPVLDQEGGHLVTDLRNDVNLDLPMDEEYEDLRAELLAYHTALASLTQAKPDQASLPTNPISEEPLPDTRRSLKSTPCWRIGGICVHKILCKTPRFLSQVPGCKNRLQVCCFTWNTFQTRDLREFGVSNAAFPWKSNGQPFGGKGLVPVEDINENALSLFGNVPFIPVSLQSKADGFKKENEKVLRTGDKESPILLILQRPDE